MKKYNSEQLENLRKSGRILRGVFDFVEKRIKPGISTLEIDSLAEDFIRSRGGDPCFKDYNGYKYTICASVNEESIHGIPGKDKILREGDIISIDCGVRWPLGKGGMCTDAARTFAVGEISDNASKLINTCKQCFDAAVKGLRAGDKVSVIGEKIEAFVDGRYGIIDTYFGHAIGENVHEEPLIPNFDVRNAERNREKLIKITDVVLHNGAIICIEPMINCGTKEVRVSKDGWTVVTADGSLAAHHENTIIIHKDSVEIVT
jgi:methionyl aminopeptidase